MSVASSTVDPRVFAAASEQVREACETRQGACAARLVDHASSDGDRQVALWMHIGVLILTILLPGLLSVLAAGPALVLWLARRDESPLVDDHGREMLNFFVSLVIYYVALGITVVGLVLWPVLWIVAIVNMVRGAIAANRGEYFRYPITIRMIR